MEYEYDNGNYCDGDWGNPVYQGDNSQSQVQFAENENNYSVSEVEFCDVEGWDTDIEVGGYIANRIASEELRDAWRAADCDVFKTFP